MEGALQEAARVEDRVREKVIQRVRAKREK